MLYVTILFIVALWTWFCVNIGWWVGCLILCCLLWMVRYLYGHCCVVIGVVGLFGVGVLFVTCCLAKVVGDCGLWLPVGLNLVFCLFYAG